MRNFKCSSCGHEFTMPFGNGVCGRQVKCPQCGAQAVRTNCQTGGGNFDGNCGMGKGGGMGRGSGGGRGGRGNSNNGKGRGF